MFKKMPVFLPFFTIYHIFYGFSVICTCEEKIKKGWEILKVPLTVSFNPNLLAVKQSRFIVNATIWIRHNPFREHLVISFYLDLGRLNSIFQSQLSIPIPILMLISCETGKIVLLLLLSLHLSLTLSPLRLFLSLSVSLSLLFFYLSFSLSRINFLNSISPQSKFQLSSSFSPVVAGSDFFHTLCTPSYEGDESGGFSSG